MLLKRVGVTCYLALTYLLNINYELKKKEKSLQQLLFVINAGHFHRLLRSHFLKNIFAQQPHKYVCISTILKFALSLF